MESKFEVLRSLLETNRSVRRFDASHKIENSVLVEIISLVRFCASGRNLQPLRYRIVNTPEECESIFPALKWAGYLPDWDGPAPEERPAAYLVQCLDTRLTNNCLCDDGLQLETITLGATAKGYGCCIIKAFNVATVTKELGLAEYLKPLYIVAIGKAMETVKLEETDGSLEADIKYYRSDDLVHHVPKRPLSQLIIK